MASSALEEKINKIRQQNEEIRRRYEEVEEDKKNAAKCNALVQMVPSSDWPERKEPPEFSNPPRVSHKPKPNKEHSEHSHQHYIGGGEGKKLHAFAQGEGPPPDPKYNFLADFEREERTISEVRDNGSGRGRGKNTRGNFKKKGPGREGYHKQEQRIHHGMYRDDCPPEYDAWRAERNRIDEDRISRQRTAEGNWRREWDNDKAHIVDDVTKRESRSSLGSFIKRDHKEFDRRYHADNNEHSNHNRGNSHRLHQGPTKIYHGNHDQRYNNSFDHGYVSPTTPKSPLSLAGADERTVIATDKSLKVTLNQGNLPKGSLMSVKVNSPSIAGTGRVGPRQRTRVTYSGHSDMEEGAQNNAGFLRQKSFEDKSRNVHSNNAQNSHNLRRSYSQRKKEGDAKSPYAQKKDFKKDGTSPNSYGPPKSPKAFRKNIKVLKNDNMNPNQQSTDENKEIIADGITVKTEEEQKDMHEIKNDIVPCQSDTCIDTMQTTTDIDTSGAEDMKTSTNNCTLGAAQSESNTQNLEPTEISHVEPNECNTVSKVENDTCASTTDTMNDSDIKSEIDNLNESLNSTIHDEMSGNVSIPDSFEKTEQHENNLPLKESVQATEKEQNSNILQEQAVEVVSENSADAKEQLVQHNEDINADQPKVLSVTEDTCTLSSATETLSVIEVDDSQQGSSVSENDKTLPVESVKHEAVINEPEVLEVTSTDVSESKPVEDDKCSASPEAQVQHVTNTDDQLQCNEKTEKQEITVVEDKERVFDKDAKNTEVVIEEEQSNANVDSDNKSSLSLAAEGQSVIETNKQLHCGNESVETQETQERQETPAAEEETKKNIKENENTVVDKLSEPPTVETNSVIEVNNQINESGDVSKPEDSKAESAFPEGKEDFVTCASDDKCSETIRNPDKILTNDNTMSSNEENGAISDNLESQTKCSDISNEIEDNKVKGIEFVMEDAKRE